MFGFFKKLFRSKSAKPSTPAGPILVHADIGESIVITEVTLASVKPKEVKPKEVKSSATVTEIKPAVATLKEVEPIAIAKGVKPKAPKAKSIKTKPVNAEPAKIVQLVQPLPTKKKGRPKKDTTV